MRVCRDLCLALLATLFLAACSSTGSQTVYSPGSGSSSEAERQATLERQRELAEMRAREEQAREEAEARRLAEARAAQERAEQERLAREAEEAARLEAQRQREIASRRAAEQARIVAAQQARIKELQARIAANEQETGNLEAANSVLRQAITAAEELTEALMAEEEKYNDTDPESGQPVQALSTAQLQSMAAEVESLSQQAESLLAKP